MVANVRKALLYMLAAYWLVTMLVVLLIFGLSAVYHLSSAAELHVSVGQSPGYLKSMPWHPLLNLPVWLLFSWLYLKREAAGRLSTEAWRLGIFWTVIAVVKDFIVWVLIPSPVQMTLHQMYVEYQPWLTLIYLVILLSPVVAGRLLATRTAHRPAVSR